MEGGELTQMKQLGEAADANHSWVAWDGMSCFASEMMILLCRAFLMNLEKLQKASFLDSIQSWDHRVPWVGEDGIRSILAHLASRRRIFCHFSKPSSELALDLISGFVAGEYLEYLFGNKVSLDFLADFRRRNAGKKAGAAKAKEADKKRKLEEEPVVPNEDGDDSKEGGIEVAEEDENN
ncbi:hypothetical protein GIB67_011820 [Kingdonia uniflora]|uniref:Uncharacterized protein n=1 Tax=Kingdonia uniflora TaxID=39325 RepID=A0A7J7NXW5_9MAGN|nr:hypothetical protein GIB67_011820 [Kingdonia uniflora]